MHKFTRATLFVASGAIALGSISAIGANAATGPHNTYSHTHTSSATGWTDTQTWHQYQSATTYNEEQITIHRATTSSGYNHSMTKHDQAGHWTAHLTGENWTAKGKVTYLNNWTHN